MTIAANDATRRLHNIIFGITFLDTNAAISKGYLENGGIEVIGEDKNCKVFDLDVDTENVICKIKKLSTMESKEMNSLPMVIRLHKDAYLLKFFQDLIAMERIGFFISGLTLKFELIKDERLVYHVI